MSWQTKVVRRKTLFDQNLYAMAHGHVSGPRRSLTDFTASDFITTDLKLIAFYFCHEVDLNVGPFQEWKQGIGTLMQKGKDLQSCI